MMRRALLATIASGALVMTVGGIAAAQAADDPSLGMERATVPEAGITMAFPEDWEVVVQMVRDEVQLPPDVICSGPCTRWHVLDAAAPDGSGCLLGMYINHPMPLAEHAKWVSTEFSEEPESISAVESESVVTPIGPAVRLDVTAVDGSAAAAYLLESDEVRYQLRCFDYEPPEDDWLSVVETIRFVPLEPVELSRPGGSGLGEAIDVALDFKTVVSVVGPEAPDFPVGSLMNADCAFALWVPSEDGSATEWLACTLSDEPLVPAEYQGVAPTEIHSESGGECIWRSDYWYQTDRSQVAASAYELIVTSGGQVYGRSTYPAEPLDCPDM